MKPSTRKGATRMTYAQVRSRQKLHLVYEPGEGRDDQHIIRVGYLSRPLCGRRVAPSGYRMTINAPLGHACRRCLSLYARRRR